MTMVARINDGITRGNFCQLRRCVNLDGVMMTSLIRGVFLKETSFCFDTITSGGYNYCVGGCLCGWKK